MIDLSSLKSPGWQRVVAELSSPANDDKAYLERLLSVVGQVSGAKQAVLFLPTAAAGTGELQARVLNIWPTPPGNTGKTPDAEAVEHGKDVRSAAVGALESNQARAYGLDEKEGLYDAAPARGYVLAIPLLGEGGRAVGAMTLLLEPRSKAAVQSTLAMAEVLAGYINVHAGRQEIKRMHQAGMALELASRLIGAVNAAPNFKGGALRLVNDLTRQFGADRAALGWVKGSAVEVVALSDAENFDKRMKMVRQIQEAMDECLDQEQAVLCPPPPEKDDLLLGQAITGAHRDLIGGDPLLSVCSIPVRRDDDTLGVLTVELKRKEGQTGLDLRGVEILQATMDLLGPVLAVKRSDSQLLPQRAVTDTRKAAAWLVGTKHTTWKLAGLLLIATFIFVAVFKVEHHVGAQAALEPRVRRTISAPFEGVVGRLGEGVEPGRVVKKGDLIVEMDTRELLLQKDAAEAKIQQAQKQMDAARSSEKVADAQLAQAALDKAVAELSIVQSRLAYARIDAPIDGTVIAGDLKDKVGASVKTGDELFQIAPLNDLLAIAKVDERDIGLVKVGGHGRIATKARPGEPFAVTVETVVPLAVAREGKNQFEIRARLDETADWLRPGMEGVVNIDAGQKSLLWIGTRRIVDTVRLWFW